MRHRGRLIGSAAAIGAFVVLGSAPLVAAPPAQADLGDFDALFEPVIDAINQAATQFDPGPGIDSVLAPAAAAVDPTSLWDLGHPFASLDALVGDWFHTVSLDLMNYLGQIWSDSPFGQLLGGVDVASHSAASSWLFGDTAGSDGAAVGAAAAEGAAAPAASAATLETASVPLRMQAVTEPVVDISVNGGSSVPVLVDTGSAGLVLPIWDIGLRGLSLPTGFGMGAYSGGLDYIYASMPATVDFGKDLATGSDIVTDPTSVNVVLFAFPTSLQSLFATGGSWGSFFAPAGVDGVLGIGPNAVGPTPGAIVTDALPGALGHGVLIDQADHRLEFGANPLTDGTVVNGAPGAALAVSINNGPLQHNVSSLIDSGGVYGTIPSSLLASTGGTVPIGTHIAVYTNDGSTLLYSYTVNASNAPTVISGGPMNTGNFPFAQQPVYIANGGSGMTIFGGVPQS